MINRAVQILRAGGLVAFPTETVYGLGADARNSDAVAKIFAAKGRPATNPLIVHVGSLDVAKANAAEWPSVFDTLAAAFWPGPLTLVVKKDPRLADAVTAGGPTVGLRVPDHPLALQLLAGFGGPIAAPSANRSNRVSPTTADHVRAELGDRVEVILNGGPCRVGIESTVLDLTRSRPTILRPGGVTREQIEALIGPIAVATAHITADQIAASPGKQPIHYAPATPTFWIDSDAPQDTSARTVQIVTAPVIFAAAATILMPAQPADYAHNLYGALREADAMGMDRILIQLPPETPEWIAVRDRILRAAQPLEEAFMSRGL